ncbi:MAG: ATP-binding protein [Bacteroidales bacterium]|nr:ATP-binding protein [Bacteroidales bacterium]
MIKRQIEDVIFQRLFKGKAIIIFGSRQTGKTTLLKTIAERYNDEYLWLNGDIEDVHLMFKNASPVKLKRIIGKKKLVFIDEAQRIKNIGLLIKMIVDELKDIQVIATGSSAFELANEISEPLTGRKYEYFLYPLSYQELEQHFGMLDEKRLLEHRLIYGSYPETIMKIGEEKETLNLISNSYLYKDLFTYEKIKKPTLLKKLLQALALQIGSEVSYNELAQLIGADKATIEKYIDLLEKTFVIFKLSALSRNARNEIKRGKKIYFYDNGIRNSLIANYTLLDQRTDKGALWENYFISERIKFINYNNYYSNIYFWRTTRQQEIDYIEERDGILHAFEIKWNEKKNVKFSKTFLNAYQNSETFIINPSNYDDFLTLQI